MRKPVRSNLSSVAVASAQRLMNLIHRRPLTQHLTRRNRLAHADIAGGTMIGAETIQQILVALVLLAPAITIELREQVRVIARDNIGLPRVALVQLRILRETGARARAARIRGRSHVPYSGARQQEYPEGRDRDHPTRPILRSICHRHLPSPQLYHPEGYVAALSKGVDRGWPMGSAALPWQALQQARG